MIQTGDDKTMPTSKINVCLFGAGEMAAIHAANLVSDPRVSLRYVIDPAADRAGALAKTHGATVVEPDVAFADPEIDAYVIASPPRTHADYLERAAQTRAYVFCEKPIDHDIDRIRTCLAKLGGNTRYNSASTAGSTSSFLGSSRRSPRAGSAMSNRC